MFDHHNGMPELKPLGKPCHDCAVVNGFYRLYSEELAKLDPERIEYISKRWFCHNNPSRSCAGNIEYQRLVNKAAGEKANWLDDIIAGLLINGVTKDEIEVREYPDATRVAVRGVERYEFKIKFTIGN